MANFTPQQIRRKHITTHARRRADAERVIAPWLEIDWDSSTHWKPYQGAAWSLSQVENKVLWSLCNSLVRQRLAFYTYYVGMPPDGVDAVGPWLAGQPIFRAMVQAILDREMALAPDVFTFVDSNLLRDDRGGMRPSRDDAAAAATQRAAFKHRKLKASPSAQPARPGRHIILPD